MKSTFLSLLRRSSQWPVLMLGTALAVPLLLALATVSPDLTSYDLGSPGDEYIASGFWPREHNGQESFRWTDGDSTLRFPGYESASALLVSFRLQGPPTGEHHPLTLIPSSSESLPIEALAQPGWRIYRLLVPHTAGGWSTPALRITSPTYDPEGADNRQLGVVLSAAWSRPIAGWRPGPILTRTSFLLLLFWIVFLILRRLSRPWLAAIGINALALTYFLAARRDPAWMAFWLPQLWFSAGLALALIYARPFLRFYQTYIAPRLPSPGLVGAGLALVGAILLSMRVLIPFGAGLLLAGALLAGCALPGAERSVPRSLIALGLASAVTVGIFVRLYQLEWLPFGLWRDEARYGVLALRILHEPSFRPVYVPGGVDYPALLFYLTAGVIKLIGVQIASVRIVAALAGGFVPLAIFFLGRRLIGPRAAFLAALLTAVAAWHISISRISFVAVLDPLFTISGLALLWEALEAREQRRRRAWAYFVLSGLSLGLALYTYHTARLMPLLAALLALTVLGRSWGRWRQAAPGLMVTALIVIALALPLLQYALTESANFNLRLRQTSATATAEQRGLSIPAILDENLGRYLLMWHLYGEPNGRHYIPGRPMLDPITGAAALCGLLLTLSRTMTPANRFLLAWLAIGLIPAILSEGAPHAVRSVGAIAPALLLAGRGLSATVEAVGKARGLPLAVGLLSAVAFLNLSLYFGRMPYDPAVWAKFHYAPETMIGRYIRHYSGSAALFIPRRIAEEDVIRYLTYGLAVGTYSPDDSPSIIPKGALVLLPAGAPEEERRWVERVADPGALPQPMQPYPGTDQPTFWLYTVQ